MSSAWDDFDDAKAQSSRLKRRTDTRESNDDNRGHVAIGCDWGQGPACEDSDPESGDGSGKESSRFIPNYEQYLQDRRSIAQKRTANRRSYQNDPHRVLLEWFESCGNGDEFSPSYEKNPETNKWVCSLDLVIDDTDFSMISEPHARRNDALNELCLDACQLLDLSGLLIKHGKTRIEEEQEDSLRRKRVSEALKEDDMVFDRTKDEQTKKKHCTPCDEATTAENASRGSASKALSSKVNTYESLMARWQELNMSILKEKAKLVKLDLSVAKPNRQTCDKKRTGNCGGGDKPSGDDVDDDDDESDSDANGSKEGQGNSDGEDPLDEFMSTLETKTKLSMDDKIEKSRIKSQIASFEREQAECARLIAIAKPSASSR